MRPVKYMTPDSYIDLVLKRSYWKGRWPYLSEAIDFAKQCRLKDSLEVLELGAYGAPIVVDSDIMDLSGKDVKYQQDATNVPWNIPDKKYSVFIALQVWEHLGDKQKEVFAEVQRIAKYAILSFPLNWNCPGDCHHGITEEKINEWTLFAEPLKKIKVGSRIVYFFKF